LYLKVYLVWIQNFVASLFELNFKTCSQSQAGIKEGLC
jgi:hypothetical protein